MTHRLNGSGIQLSIGAESDVGRVRVMNQDSFLYQPNMAVVADGMGGHRGGEVASKIAVETLGDEFDGASVESLEAAMLAANRKILAQAVENPDLRGMGTTMCAVAVIEENGEVSVGIVNVGDSRVYRLAAGVFEQVTEDHSLVESMVREGRLTAAEAEVHPQRNIVTRALGASENVQVDSFVFAPVVGHRYLLCSDGLSNEVTNDEISAILRTYGDPAAAATALIEAANAGGGRDNITSVVVDIIAADGTETAPMEVVPSDEPVVEAPEDAPDEVVPPDEPVVEAPEDAPDEVVPSDEPDAEAPQGIAPPAPKWRLWRRG